MLPSLTTRCCRRRTEETGDEPDDVTGLQFDPPESDQSDPDHTALTGEHEQTAQEYLDDDESELGAQAEG